MKTNWQPVLKALLIGCLTTAVTASAIAAEDESAKRAAELAPQPRTDLTLGQPAGISNSRAASLVKQRYSDARILAVTILNESGPPIYKVRTLSQEGVVRSVFVDGRTGEVFE